jgi:hypothetical protein
LSLFLAAKQSDSVPFFIHSFLSSFFPADDAIEQYLRDNNVGVDARVITDDAFVAALTRVPPETSIKDALTNESFIAYVVQCNAVCVISRCAISSHAFTLTTPCD